MEYVAALLHYASSLLTISVKVAYPAWASFKAIKSNGGSDDTTWLIYWCVMAISSFAEVYLVPFVQFVPFFMLLRLCYYVWLQLPVCNGSIILYKKFVMPFLTKNSEFFDKITIEDTADLTQTYRNIKTDLNAKYGEIKASLD